jgi:prepilin-type processing-associated H-X9-DG protein
MTADVEGDPDFTDSGSKPKSRRKHRLLEIFAGLGILLVLVALFLPANRSARGAAQRAQCTNNLKQIALALHSYEELHKALPPAYTVDSSGRPLHSWRTLILPFLEQESLYKTIDLSRPWNDPANAKAYHSSLAVFRCPARIGPPSTTTYLAVVDPKGCLQPDRPRQLAEITDGTATTLMVIEVGEEHAVHWMAPIDTDESLVVGFGPTTKLDHIGGTNACFVDGHVLFLRASTPAALRRALISIAGNDQDALRIGDDLGY